jgi:long-chain fatty acid transport protein
MNANRSARTLLLIACLVPAGARAAGYGVYEQGAAALGMAGAFCATANDATAQFYNPAAMSWLEGTRLAGGASWLSTRTSFAGIPEYPGYGTVEEMEAGNFFPPAVYWTQRFGSRFAVGAGVNAPFGLGVEWQDPATFTARERVTKAVLETLKASGSVALRVTDYWSVAAGADMLNARVELNNISTVIGDGGAPINAIQVKLESDFTPGWGYHVALNGRPTESWRLGAMYRSQIDVDVTDGRATFTQIPTGDPALDAVVAANQPPNQPVATKLVFPASVTLAIAWTPSAEWTYEVDGIWTGWSAFQELDLEFPEDPSLDQTIVEDYNDQFAVRVGTERRFPRYALRGGYYYDQAAAPAESVTPLLPDATRHGFTLGLGMQRGAWTIDVYNLFLFVEKRSTEGREREGYDGVYKSYVNSLGATLAYRW